MDQRPLWSFLVFVYQTIAVSCLTKEEFASQDVIQSLGSTANSNWAVIVETSRYWYNYRHAANSLSFYRTAKRLGIPDNRILLFLGDDFACDARNISPGAIYNDRERGVNVYGTDAEVDFRSADTTVDQLIRVLTGRQHRWTARTKRLLTDERSNIFIFMSGHGGDKFLKFQDFEEIGTRDLANAFIQMKEQKRYRGILFVADTCQASTLADDFSAPNIISIGSSAKGENSWSHHLDEGIGLAVIDRFTYFSLQFFEAMKSTSNKTIAQWAKYLTKARLNSTVVARDDIGGRRLDSTKVTEYLGSSGASQFLFLAPFPILPVRT